MVNRCNTIASCDEVCNAQVTIVQWWMECAVWTNTSYPITVSVHILQLPCATAESLHNCTHAQRAERLQGCQRTCIARLLYYTAATLHTRNSAAIQQTLNRCCGSQAVATTATEAFSTHTCLQMKCPGARQGGLHLCCLNIQLMSYIATIPCCCFPFPTQAALSCPAEQKTRAPAFPCPYCCCCC